MRFSRFGVTAAVVAAATVVIGAATAAGPSPGIVNGLGGVTAGGGQVRFVAVTSARDTVLEKIDTRSGRVLRFRSLRGTYGIPLAAFDGTPTGLPYDERSLVLSTFPGSGAFTRFAVFDTRTLKIRKRIALQGTWSLDALSPDGGTLFLIQYLPSDNSITYRVRAYDLRADRLIAGSIVDKRDPEAMTGLPMTRVTGADATWAYTLYSRDASYGGKTSTAFIHALDTRHGAAVCIDLPWTVGPDALSHVRMSLDKEGLVLSQSPVGRLAVVDLTTFAVHALRSPAGAR
jgi:hypothetical protein